MNFIFDKSIEESRGKFTERTCDKSKFIYSVLEKHNKDDYLILPALELNYNNIIAVEFDNVNDYILEKDLNDTLEFDIKKLKIENKNNNNNNEKLEIKMAPETPIDRQNPLPSNELY